MLTKQPPINLKSMRFPRELEADKNLEYIRQKLFADAVLLRPDSDFAVPRIEMNKVLKNAVLKARLHRHVCCGFDAIARKLENEKAGIAGVCKQLNTPYGNRISRLILFSNDGAPRLYRHIEQLLTINFPRLLGCLINMESKAFGHLINSKDSKIKIMMVENKNAVCEVLRAMTAGPDNKSENINRILLRF